MNTFIYQQGRVTDRGYTEKQTIQAATDIHAHNSKISTELTQQQSEVT